MNTSVKTLIGFSLLLVVALLYAYITWPRQARVTKVPASDMSTAIASNSGALPSSINISQEAPIPEENETLVNRNIFAPLFSLPLPSSMPDNQDTLSENSSALPVEVLPPPRPMPIFLGQLRHAGQQKVFLSIEGKVYVVGHDDSFGPDNAYRLVGISSESVIVKHRDDKNTFQIEAAEPPISVLSSSGSSYVEPMQPGDSTEISVPVEPERLDKEVPIDNVVDE